MGMKAKVATPPPIDTSVTDRTAEKEAKLELEKKRMLDAGAKGRASTILTGGQGLLEQPEVGKTMLGGTL
jgi:hypothetical protein|tara:strand:+ start:601 stop:810 length:210 start_codon:yes stop_codon:yes gene_type:complete